MIRFALVIPFALATAYAQQRRYSRQGQRLLWATSIVAAFTIGFME